MTSRRGAIVGAAFLALVYFAIEALYIVRLPLVMDELLNAYVLRLFATGLPFRDFQPPKTVLGSYLELPAFLAASDPWNAMLAVKFELAALMALTIFVGALILFRHLPRAAVLTATAMLVVVSTFLERSAELRVDQVAAMFGFFSLLALIERRPALAGLLAACAFLSTQKGVYFVLAAQVALIAESLRTRAIPPRRAWLRFSVASAVALVTYIAIWSILASPHTVISSTFFDKNILRIATAPAYEIRARYWEQTIVRNPLFYLLGLAGIVVLLRRWWNGALDHLGVLAPYATALLALCMLHRQPWPYFFVNLIPTLFAVIAVLFADLLQEGRPRRLIIAAVAVLGIVLPLLRLNVALRRSSALQRATFVAAGSLLETDERYVDGVSMIYRRDQATPDTTWIDAMQWNDIRAASPAETIDLVRRIDASHPKLVLINYRTLALPDMVRAYVRSQFAPLWGNIFYYAPVVAPPGFSLHFDGVYAADRPATIDGIPVQAGQRVTLRKGTHAMLASHPVRLSLLPPASAALDPRFARGGDLFPSVYDY